MKTLLSILIFTISVNLSAQINKEYLKVGEMAPEINGVDQNGEEINSTEILKSNKILMVFYRGNWCPHCKKHLGSLQEHLNEFKEKDVFVMVVTPETVEKTKETEQKFKTDFSIVHDVDNKIMNDYKVAFDVNKENVPSYYGFITDKVAEYNVENNKVLPVPATYLIGRDGRIIYVQYDPDYKNRSDFSEILKSL
jgi:peroxiredoxin